jgi:DNA-binding NarL/FixJ family response regulator
MNATPLLDFEYALARIAPDGRIRDSEDVEALAFLYSRLDLAGDDLQSPNVTSEDGSDDVRSAVASIVVIDDQLAFAEALGIAVSLTDDLTVVGRAPDAGSGVDLVLLEKPDLVVCDYRLPGEVSGVECARQLRAAGHAGPIVILTGYPAPQVHRESAGLTGSTVQVLGKDQPVQAIVESFRDAIAGHAPTVPANAATDATGVVLTEAELEVLEMINAGMSASEIASELFLSVHAVRSRIKSTLRKLDASSQIEAIATATRMGILVPPG